MIDPIMNLITGTRDKIENYFRVGWKFSILFWNELGGLKG
jgi:hypothetical protein